MELLYLYRYILFDINGKHRYFNIASENYDICQVSDMCFMV